MSNSIEIDTPVRDHVYAEGHANRAAEAATAAAEAIAEDRIHDARALLNQVDECTKRALLGLLRGAH